MPGLPGQDTKAGMVIYTKNDLTKACGHRTEGAKSVHRYSISFAGFTFTFVTIDKQSYGKESVEIKGPGHPTETATPTTTPTATPTPTPTPTPVASWGKSGPGVAAPGNELPYTIALSWDSSDGSPGPSVLYDPIPEHTEYVPGSGSATLGNMDTSHKDAIVRAGTIPDGGRTVISFTVRIPCEELMKTKIDEWPKTIENWATGNISTSSYVVTESTELLKPGFTISALEVNQAIQNLKNEMHLIKEKETYVRVYLQTEYHNGVEGCAVPDVTARLSGGRSSDLKPITGSITAEVLVGQDRPTRDERDDLNKSLYFRLPSPWGSPDCYVLTAEVNPDGERPDHNTENNTKKRGLDFVETDRLHLYLVPIKYVVGGANVQPDQSDFNRAITFLGIYPVPDENRKIRWTAPYILEYPIRHDAPEHGLLWHIWKMNSFRSDTHLTENTYYVSVLHPGVGTSGVDGLGYVDRYASWMKISQRSGPTAAHELGHTTWGVGTSTIRQAAQASQRRTRTPPVSSAPGVAPTTMLRHRSPQRQRAESSHERGCRELQLLDWYSTVGL